MDQADNEWINPRVDDMWIEHSRIHYERFNDSGFIIIIFMKD